MRPAMRGHHDVGRSRKSRPCTATARFLLRDAADINHVLVHLVTHWKPPGVDVRIDRLPALESQRAQDRFVRLAENCNCVAGEMLGIATLVVGCWVSWVATRGRINPGLVMVAALSAALIGKAVELAWTRARLLLVLRELRNRLDQTVAGRTAGMQLKVAANPAPLGDPVAGRSFGYALNREDGDVLQTDRIRPPTHLLFRIVPGSFCAMSVTSTGLRSAWLPTGRCHTSRSSSTRFPGVPCNAHRIVWCACLRIAATCSLRCWR